MNPHTKPQSRREAEPEAGLAFDAYAALMRTLMREPGLALNPYWSALCDTAHARFRAVFEREATK